jgi:hypothetical protein
MCAPCDWQLEYIFGCGISIPIVMLVKVTKAAVRKIKQR